MLPRPPIERGSEIDGRSGKNGNNGAVIRRHFRSVGSTNTAAAVWVRGDAPEDGLPDDAGLRDSDWALVTADRQTAGRGRPGAAWVSDGRSLTMSLIAPAGSVLPSGRLAIGVGVAVAETVGVGLKWPNDLGWIDREGAFVKVGGILIEVVARRLVIGIGVNCGGGTGEFAGVEAAAGELIDPIATAVRSVVDQSPDAWDDVAVRYERLCVLSGREVSWTADNRLHRGNCVGIDDQGRLVVRTGAGTVSLVSADVRHVRPSRDTPPSD